MLRLFEWGVIVCIIALLYGLFLNRMGRAQAAIERQNFLTTVRGMRTAVLLQSVIKPWEVTPGDNPVAVYHDQFGLLPAGYAGVKDGLDPAAVAVGSWYFDKRERQLIYRVSNTGYFQSTLDGVPRLRLQLLRKDDSERLTVSILDDGDWTVGGDDLVK